MKKTILLFFCFVFLVGCAPRVMVDLSQDQTPLDFRQKVVVLDLPDIVPPNARLIGIVKVGDSGFTFDCDFPVVLEKAEIEARKAGGNLLKITEHKTPDFKSTCHRITAEIYFLENIDQQIFVTNTEPEYFDTTANYALIHIYRKGSYGALVSYMLHLGDTELCRVNVNCQETVMVMPEGPNELWAKTESKLAIPINIEHGKEYYVRCGVSMGLFIGRPTLILVDNRTGKSEFEAKGKK